MPEAMRVGMIGCGAISGAYCQGARRSEDVQIVAAADLNHAAAEAKAREFDIPRVLPVDELLASDDVDLVLNLTVPVAHAGLSRAALLSGKHVYSEKPLATTRQEGLEILQLAQANGLRLGCAPDTFMGSGIQTARKLIEDGELGRPVAFTAWMMCPGHESWHPHPDFYYQPGGGPMFDMGPYYLTALLNLFGPIRRVSASASIAISRRTVGSGPRSGQSITVNTPDHVCGTIDFQNGVVGSIMMSFATHFPAHDARWPITVYGSGGTLRVPDPNQIDGSVLIRRVNDPDWQQANVDFVTGSTRSIGLADMAQAIRAGRPHRASGEMAFAVLDAMAGMLESAESGRAHEPRVQFKRPDPMLPVPRG